MGLYIIRSACDQLDYVREMGANTLVLTVVERAR
jgi:hypothetical protein